MFHDCLQIGQRPGATFSSCPFRDLRHFGMNEDSLDGDLVAGLEFAGGLGEGDLGEWEKGVGGECLSVLEQE